MHDTVAPVRSAYVMFQAKFVLELMIRLLARRAGFYRANHHPLRHIGQAVVEVIFAPAAGAPSTHRYAKFPNAMHQGSLDPGITVSISIKWILTCNRKF